MVFLFLLALSTPVFSAQVERSLKLPAEGITELSVDAGAGSLDIRGEEGLSSIEVRAEIYSSLSGRRKARRIFKGSILRFSLEKSGGEAVLKGTSTSSESSSRGMRPSI